MIELRINNVPLDMFIGQSISLEDNNPMFSEDVIPGTFSLPFDLPASSKNRQILGFPELLNLASKPTLKYDNVQVWIDGIPWRKGELIFRGYSRGRYRVNFQVNTSVLGDMIKNQKLRDLNHTKINVVDWMQVEDDRSGPFLEYELRYRKYIEFTTEITDATPIVVTINGQTFSDEGGDLKQLVNDADLGITLEMFNEALVGYRLVLLFRSETNADISSGSFDITVSGGVPSHASWQIRKYYYNQYAPQSLIDYAHVDQLTSDCVFPACQIDNFYDDESMIGVFNAELNGSYLPEYGFIPQFFLSYVFRKITEKTGLRFSGEFIESEIFEKAILFNTHSLDYFEDVSGQKIRMLMDKINPADHIPDMTVSELLIELKKMMNIGWDYHIDDNTLEIFFLRDQIVTTEFVESSSKFNPDYDLEYNVKDGVTLSYEWDDDDENASKIESSLYGSIKIGGGEKEIISKISTAIMDVRQNPAVPAAKYRIPVANQNGTWFGEKNDGKIRLLLYHGTAQDSLGNDYTYASSDNIDYSGTRRGDYSLTWKGADGLYEKLWKGWAEFLADDIPSKRVAYWSIVDLLNFDYRKKYRIDGVRYFIRKLSFAVSNRINHIDVELMKAE